MWLIIISIVTLIIAILSIVFNIFLYKKNNSLKTGIYDVRVEIEQERNSNYTRLAGFAKKISEEFESVYEIIGYTQEKLPKEEIN